MTENPINAGRQHNLHEDLDIPQAPTPVIKLLLLTVNNLIHAESREQTIFYDLIIVNDTPLRLRRVVIGWYYLRFVTFTVVESTTQLSA